MGGQKVVVVCGELWGTNVACYYKPYAICAWSSWPTYTWHCSLHSRSPGNSLVSSCDHSMLASLLCVLCCPRNPQNISQSFHHKGVETCFFILSESNSPSTQRKITFALSTKKRELTSQQRDWLEATCVCGRRVRRSWQT